jgi:hypothetical protein
MCYEMGGLIWFQAGVLLDTIQLYFFKAKHELQGLFDFVEFSGVRLEGSSTAEFAEGVEIQHS